MLMDEQTPRQTEPYSNTPADLKVTAEIIKEMTKAQFSHTFCTHSDFDYYFDTVSFMAMIFLKFIIIS